MIQIDAVGWSEEYLTKTCSKCDSDNSLQFVRTQKRYKIGNFKLINSGSRHFGRECFNCFNLTPISKSDLRTVTKLDYYFKRPTEENINRKSYYARNVKFPVLDKKKRDEIRSENIKEGLMSMVIGSIVGVIIALFYGPAIWIVPIMLLFGIYAALEDPETKFKGLIEKSKGVRPKRRDSKRRLQ
ncbi:MAG: hypothetical protein HeimC2_23750 [Candidatus Heimdallarchaeota archaeon LC_2]|nr:MAG: hypothetical protein HeimC2_23750 [Candidatus Heimdallarchaeota archaeon LC_2]